MVEEALEIESYAAHDEPLHLASHWASTHEQSSPEHEGAAAGRCRAVITRGCAERTARAVVAHWHNGTAARHRMFFQRMRYRLALCRWRDYDADVSRCVRAC